MTTQAPGCCGNMTKDDPSAAAEANEVERGESNRTCWDWCISSGEEQRRGSIRFGFLLILLGLIWLGGAVGRLPESTIWPLTAITIGLWLAVISRIRWKRNS